MTPSPLPIEAAGARDYELVVPVRLPDGMTPEEFLLQTRLEWGKGGHFNTRGAVALRYGPDLDTIPEFTGPKELRHA